MLIATAIGLVVSLSKESPVPPGWIVFAAIFAIAIALYSAIAGWCREVDSLTSKDAEGLIGVCLAIHVQLMQELQAFLEVRGDPFTMKDDSIRITVYRVVPDPETGVAKVMQQIMPYIGGPDTIERHRITERKGIVGLSAHTGEFEIDTASENPSERISLITRRYFFTEAEATDVKVDRLGWAAFPIEIDGYLCPIAVVYLDTEFREFFADEANKELISEAMIPIQTYIEQRML